MKNRMLYKMNKFQKKIIVMMLSLSLIFVYSIPYFAEDMMDSDLCVDVEDEMIEEENIDALEEKNTDVSEEEMVEITEDEKDEIVEEENGEVPEEKNDEIVEEENNEIPEAVNDEVVEEENNEVTEEENNEVTEEENDEVVEEEKSEVIEEKNDEVTEERIDEEVECEADEIILADEITEGKEEFDDKVMEEIADDQLFDDSAIIIDEDVFDKEDDNIEKSDEIVEKEVATISELEEVETAIISEVEEVIEEVATTSVISVKLFWIDSMNLKESGVSGSYNYEWDTFTVKKGEDFTAPDNVVKDIKHSSCNQVYKFLGFTTEDQKTKYWLHADYATGEKMFDKTFSVENDMVVWAVYEAKDTYVSSIKFVDGELTFKTTTIPNIAIKNIIVSDKAFESLKDGYKLLKNGDRYIAYTKDSAEGMPMLEEDVKRKIFE